MKGLALILGKAKPKAGPADAGAEAEGMDDAGQAKADLATALSEMDAADSPETKAEAFLRALELAESCKGYDTAGDD